MHMLQLVGLRPGHAQRYARVAGRCAFGARTGRSGFDTSGSKWELNRYV